MPRDSGGTYTLPAGNPVTTGTAVSSTWANNTLNDIVTALTGSLSRSGDGSMLAPLELDNGTVGVPGLSFGSETGLGLYRVSAGVLGVAQGGSLVASFGTAGMYIVGTLDLGHASDTTLARVAAGRVSVEGVELARLGAAGAFTAAQQFTTLEVGHATDTTLARVAAGRLSVEGVELARLGAAQEFTAAQQFPTIELGHATDTTLARVAAGRISVEGVELARLGAAGAFTAAQEFTTIELGHASDTTLARIAAGRVSIEGIEIGFRQIRRSATTSGVLTAAESGLCVPATAGVTINPSVFATGDAVTIYNDSGASITITQGVSMTLRLAGTATTGNRTLAQRGVVTIWFDEHNDAVITGTGLS